MSHLPHLIILSSLLTLGLQLQAEEPPPNIGDAVPGAHQEKQVAVEGLRAGMHAFTMPWNDGAPGPTDLSGLNHKPAGCMGLMQARPDGNIYAGDGDEAQRFLAVNLIFSAAHPPKEEATGAARRLAKFGVNLVRFHHIDNKRALLTNPKDSRQFDAEALDRFDFLVHQLKEHGIYSNFNLLVSRRFSNGDGIGPIAAIKGKLQHLIGMWYEPAFQLHADYARKLLGHTNPYTGLRYADDPAIAFIEIINENGLANCWLAAQKDTPFAADPADLPDLYKTPLRQRWHASALKKHHSVSKAAAHWQLPSNSPIIADQNKLDFPDPKQWSEYASTLKADWLACLRDIEADYYHRMRQVIREEIGSKAMIMGSTLHSGWPSLNQEMDCVDGHVYYDNPRWRGKRWAFAGKDWSINNRSQVDNGGPAGRLGWISMGQMAGKPYSVTEYNHAAPNVFAGETPLYLSTYASLQGWDAIYLFPYAGNRLTNGIMMGLELCNHPSKMANMLVAAALFRRGDLRHLQTVHNGHLNSHTELDIAANKGSTWNMVTGFKLGLKSKNILRHRLQMRLFTDKDTLPAQTTIPDYDDSGSITTPDGQVTRDTSDQRGAIMSINTKRTKSVFGMIAERRFVFDNVEFHVGPNMDGGGCLSLIHMEGQNIGSTGRALIIATARAENAGMLWRKVETDYHRKHEIRYELESWGHPPTTIEPLTGMVRLPGTPETVTVHSLDGSGQRMGTVPVVLAGPNQVSVQLGNKPTLWYEIIWH